MAKNRRRAEAETESRERKARRETADKERIKRKAGDKQQEREGRGERKREDERKSLKEADEKRRKRHLVGVAWGFDDRAGARTGTSAEEAEGSYSPKGNTQHGKERDAGHCEDADKKRNVWGVEAGGPGPEIVFEFGVPRARQRSESMGRLEEAAMNRPCMGKCCRTGIDRDLG
jgi:hypothetical protein